MRPGVVKSGGDSLTLRIGDRYHRMVTALRAICIAIALAAGPERQLVDEVVAVVDTHSITLSELVAETRIRLAMAQGPQAALAPLDRKLLGASLRKTVEERVVLAEIERLKLFDLDKAEVDAQMLRLKSHFPGEQEYDSFTRSIELTEEEIAGVLARELRVARYLDNRLKLAAQLRDSELDDATRGRKMTASEREIVKERLGQEKYQRLLQELLASLRERTSVRILDALDEGQVAEH